MRATATIALASLVLSCGHALAADAAAKRKANAPAASALKATLADVAYGTHPQQKLDFYRAASAKPTPVLFFIHGGGWKNGDKSGFNNQGPYLAAGISVVSINYRHIEHAEAEDKEGAHSANFGVGLAEKLKREGVKHELVYPGAVDVKHANVHAYLIESLQAKR